MTTKRYIYSTPTGLLNGRVDISILRFEVKFGLYFKMPFRCPTKGEYLTYQGTMHFAGNTFASL